MVPDGARLSVMGKFFASLASTPFLVSFVSTVNGDQLKSIFENGARFDVVEFEEEDRYLRMTWYAMSHHTDNVRFTPTSIMQFVKMAEETYRKLGNQDFCT